MNHMKRKKNNTQKGFLELIVIILIALILLRFLGIDIETILAKQWVKDFFGYVKDMLVLVWQDFLEIISAIKNSYKSSLLPKKMYSLELLLIESCNLLVVSHF